MKKFIKLIIDKIIYFIFESNYFKDNTKINSHLLYLSLISNKKYSSPKNLLPHGFSIFSQGDEDGIIDEIFKRIGLKDKYFLELGVENGVECNTAYLLLKGWEGLWVEGSKKNASKAKQNFIKYLNKGSLKIYNQFITTENSKGFFEHEINNHNLDLLSIDIGNYTYHILSQILFMNPRLIVVEYNAKFGSECEFVSNNTKGYWDGSINYGASLKSFEQLLLGKYSLIGCSITGANAFFLSNKENLSKFESPFVSEKHYESEKYYLTNYFKSYHKNLIEFK